MFAMPVREVHVSDFLDELGIRTRRIPFGGTIETTFRCNLRCVHCYVNQPADAGVERDRELPLDRHLRLIDEITNAGCVSLLLTGGEVLVRPDFAELYEYAVRRGLRLSVFTNATLVSDRVLDLFQRLPPIGVEVTLYGATRETYERITRVAGSFDRCIAGIEGMLARGINVKLKTMVMTWNEREIEAMRSFAHRLGVAFRHDGLLNPRVDCGANRNPELQLPADRLAAVDLSDPATEKRFRRSAETVLCSGSDRQRSQFVYSCGGGHSSFTVDPYGNLLLCLLSRRSRFDLRDDTFMRGWEELLPRVRSRKWQSGSICENCSLLPLCGSCPGVAEMEHGDPESQVALCCEVTHRRTFGILGDACGHAPDASCCLKSAGPPAG
ncbi:MAG: radical SAM protein [Acidobacteriota bacterium]